MECGTEINVVKGILDHLFDDFDINVFDDFDNDVFLQLSEYAIERFNDTNGTIINAVRQWILLPKMEARPTYTYHIYDNSFHHWLEKDRTTSIHNINLRIVSGKLALRFWNILVGIIQRLLPEYANTIKEYIVNTAI